MYAGCNFQILGGTTINASGDNVGTYDCDGFGTCVLIDSYFDASAPYTPIEPDEEEIDLTPENPNSNSPGASAVAKSGATTSDWCSGGLGGGGGGSGGVGSVITLRPIHPGVRSEITLRPFYRAYGGTGSSGGNGGTRAMREKKTIVALQPVSSITCDDIEEIRLGVVNSAALFYRGVARRGDLFQVTLGRGVIETWEFIAGGNMAGGTIINVSPVSSGCPGY